MVFVDPPFRKGCWKRRYPLLEQQNGWLADDALIYALKAKWKTVYRRCPAHWDLHREKLLVRSLIVFITVRHKEALMPVLINLGRLLMLGVWAF